MSPDDAAYVADLIRTARGHYAEAVALLNEAGRIAGGQARDAVPVVYLASARYYTPGRGEPS